MEVRFRVNLDFDAALSRNNKNFKNEKFLKELEYIFFLVNNGSNVTLCSQNKYSNKYLSHLHDLGFTIPNIDDNITNYINWWGNLENFEQVKETNSKCALAKWHRPLADKIIRSKEDLEESFPTFYRPDQTFSGIGNKVLNSVKDFERLGFPGVQSRYVKVVKTFGVTYDFKNNDYFIVENFVSDKGEFKGGRLIQINELPISFDLEKYINDIKEHIPEALLNNKIQFDNMIYLENSETKICPIVEINYRRTMGEVIMNITKVLGDGTLYFGDKTALNSNSLILSPDFVKNICYFNRA